ncbi:MAG: hypothetical protein SWQ30_19285 [Thermodesulfobacteriota bacterium]|nr:hypothetical protein [Thermodesulfobacteriota bacterium]
MLFETTNTDYKDQIPGSLYAPIDPKYIYSVNRTATCHSPASYGFPGDHSANSDGYGLQQLIDQRQQLNLFKGQMLLSEIYQRDRLRGENLYQIYVDQNTCRDLMSLIGDSLVDGRRIALEREIIALEQEKRQERASYFRDVSFLRKELRQVLVDRLEEEQKAALLIDQKEGFV